MAARGQTSDRHIWGLIRGVGTISIKRRDRAAINTVRGDPEIRTSPADPGYSGAIKVYSYASAIYLSSRRGVPCNIRVVIVAVVRSGDALSRPIKCKSISGGLGAVQARIDNVGVVIVCDDSLWWWWWWWCVSSDRKRRARQHTITAILKEDRDVIPGNGGRRKATRPGCRIWRAGWGGVRAVEVVPSVSEAIALCTAWGYATIADPHPIALGARSVGDCNRDRRAGGHRRSAVRTIHRYRRRGWRWHGHLKWRARQNIISIIGEKDRVVVAGGRWCREAACGRCQAGRRCCVRTV